MPSDLTVDDIKAYLRERIDFLTDTLARDHVSLKRRPHLESAQSQYASILRWISSAEHGTDGITHEQHTHKPHVSAPR